MVAKRLVGAEQLAGTPSGKHGTMSDAPETFANLPPYTYVPGHAPHPASDPAGHMRDSGVPDDWTPSDHLRWGKKLFQHGFYWEAHEAWEHLWMELGRTSDEALIVKGLIKLAASAVKCREGNAVGSKRHAVRAVELLGSGSSASMFDSINLPAALESAERFAEAPPIDHTAPSYRPVSLPGLRI